MSLRLANGIRISMALVVLMTASAVFASPAADRFQGHWEADVTGDGKTFTFLFDFQTKGDVLTGTVELSSQDRSFEIKNGKITGDTISFLGFGIWTGKLEGGELKLTRELDYGKKQQMVAHRAKSN